MIFTSVAILYKITFKFYVNKGKTLPLPNIYYLEILINDFNHEKLFNCAFDAIFFK